MPNILFIILISAFTLLISFVSVKGTLSNLRYKKQWWKIITIRGWIVIGLTLAIIGLLILQNNLNERKSDKNDEALKKEREKGDSIITAGITAGVDSNRKVLFKDLSEALAKQNLRLDTVSKKLEILKDSVGRTVIIKNDKRPSFELCPEGVIFENKTYPKLIVPYCGFDDWVKINDVTTYVILIDTLNVLHLLDKKKAPYPNSELSPTKASTMEVDLRNINLGVVKGFYIYLIGNYTDKNNSTKYPIDIAYYYGFVSKVFSYLVGQLRQNMIDFLKINGQF